MALIDVMVILVTFSVSLCLSCPFHDELGNSSLILARKAALDRTNQLRKMHGSPPLEQDAEANKVAQAYAAHLCETCMLAHSGNRKYGENVSGTCGFSVDTSTDQKWADFAVWRINSFYEEEKQYDYNNPGFSMQAGHFTALVWKGTKYQGVGVSACKKGGFVVINYKPRGNNEYAEEFAANVGRKV